MGGDLLTDTLRIGLLDGGTVLPYYRREHGGGIPNCAIDRAGDWEGQTSTSLVHSRLSSTVFMKATEASASKRYHRYLPNAHITHHPGERTRQPAKARHGVIVHSLDQREWLGCGRRRAASQNRIPTESMR